MIFFYLELHLDKLYYLGGLEIKVKVIYQEIEDESFRNAFQEVIAGHSPEVIPKIIRSYSSNTGCIVKYTCVILLGKDVTRIDIAHPSRRVNVSEIEALEKMLNLRFNIDFLSVENQEYNFGYLSTFTNNKDIYDKICEDG